MNSTRILFLAYINRSGSTFLAELISAHPEICVCPEAEILIRELLRNKSETKFEKDSKIESIRRALSRDAKLSAWGVDFVQILPKLESAVSDYDLFSKFLSAYRDQVKPNARIIVFKGTELLNVYADLEIEIRPPCMVITRDGRAAYASQKKSKGSLSGMPMHVSPVIAAVQWSSFTDKVLADTSILHCKYEDLVLENDITLKRIWNFLGVDKPDAANVDGDLTSRIPENQKHLHINIGKGPIQSRIDSWKKDLNPTEITLFEKEAGQTLAALDYKLLKPNKPGLAVFVSRVYYALKHEINQALNRVILRIKK